MADEWVKFWSTLVSGSKRALPRATRFIFMELSLKVRPGNGSIRIRHDLSVAAAVHDILGGGPRERREVSDAIEALTTCERGENPMITIHEAGGIRTLTIPSWEEWNARDDSRERVKKHRKNRVKKTDVTRYSNDRNGDETGYGNDGNGHVTLLEVEGEIEIDHPPTEGVVTPPPAHPPAPTKLSNLGKSVARVIAARAELFGSLTKREIATYVEPIDRALARVPPEAMWPDLDAEVEHWITFARNKRDEKHAAWSPTRLLGEVESFARMRCRERPAKALEERDRSRQKTRRSFGGGASGGAAEDDEFGGSVLEFEESLRKRAKRVDQPSAANDATSIGDILGHQVKRPTGTDDAGS